jgi:hypothetical protein
MKKMEAASIAEITNSALCHLGEPTAHRIAIQQARNTAHTIAIFIRTIERRASSSFATARSFHQGEWVRHTLDSSAYARSSETT